MKTKVTKNIVLIVLLLIILVSCKKRYEEGPIINFKDVNVRITGEWEATKLNINSVDKFYLIDSLNIGRYRFQFSDGHKEFSSKYVGGFSAIDKQGNDIRQDTAFSICSFYDNHEKLNFFPISYYPTLPKPLVFFPNYYQFTHLKSEGWKIIKLTKKEMKLQSLEYDIDLEMKKVKELSVN